MMDTSEPTLRALNPELDARNLEILATRARAYAARERPQVGDFARMPDGSLRRFTHDWGDGLQTTCGPSHPCVGDQSFYLSEHGADFSGSLDSIVSVQRISATAETLPGAFWFFRNNYVTAHNGLRGLRMPCRVWVVAAERT